MRLFLSISLDENLKGKVLDIIKLLEKKYAGIRFVEPENLHLTIKFLGEVGVNKIDEVKIKSEEVASMFHKFRIHIANMACFDSLDSIRVLWLDVCEGREHIVKLIKEFNSSLDYIRREEKPPKPHLTIGRANNIKNKELSKEIEGMKNLDIGEMLVEKVSLNSSEMRPEGVRYSCLKTFSLKD